MPDNPTFPQFFAPVEPADPVDPTELSVVLPDQTHELDPLRAALAADPLYQALLPRIGEPGDQLGSLIFPDTGGMYEDLFDPGQHIRIDRDLQRDVAFYEDRYKHAVTRKLGWAGGGYIEDFLRGSARTLYSGVAIPMRGAKNFLSLQDRISGTYGTYARLLVGEDADPIAILTDLIDQVDVLQIEDKEARLKYLSEMRQEMMRDRADPDRQGRLKGKAREVADKLAEWGNGVEEFVNLYMARHDRPGWGDNVANFAGEMAGGIAPWVIAGGRGGPVGLGALIGAHGLDKAARVAEEEDDLTAGIGAGLLEVGVLYLIFGRAHRRGGAATTSLKSAITKIQMNKQSMRYLGGLVARQRVAELGKALTQYGLGISEITGIRIAQNYVDHTQRAIFGPALLQDSLNRANEDLYDVAMGGLVEGASLMGLSAVGGSITATGGLVFSPSTFRSLRQPNRLLESVGEATVVRESLSRSLENADLAQLERVRDRIANDPMLGESAQARDTLKIIEGAIKARVEGRKVRREDIGEMELDMEKVTGPELVADLETSNRILREAAVEEGISLTPVGEMSATAAEGLKGRRRVRTISEELAKEASRLADGMRAEKVLEAELAVRSDVDVLVDTAIVGVDTIANADIPQARAEIARARREGKHEGEPLTSEQLTFFDLFDQALRIREEAIRLEGDPMAKLRETLDGFEGLTGTELQRLASELGLHKGPFRKMDDAFKVEIRRELEAAIRESEAEVKREELARTPEERAAAKKEAREVKPRINRLTGVVRDKSIFSLSQKDLFARLEKETGVAHEAGRREGAAKELQRGRVKLEKEREKARTAKRSAKIASDAYRRWVRESGLPKATQDRLLARKRNIKDMESARKALTELLGEIDKARTNDATARITKVFAKRLKVARGLRIPRGLAPGLDGIMLSLLARMDPAGYAKLGRREAPKMEDAKKKYEAETGEVLLDVVSRLAEKVETEGMESLGSRELEMLADFLEHVQELNTGIRRGRRLAEKVRRDRRERLIIEELESTHSIKRKRDREEREVGEGESAVQRRMMSGVRMVAGISTHGRLPTILEYMSGGNNTEMWEAVYGQMEAARGRMDTEYYDNAALQREIFEAHGVKPETLAAESRYYKKYGPLGWILKKISGGRMRSDRAYKIEIDRGEFINWTSPELAEYLVQMKDPSTREHLLGPKNEYRPDRKGVPNVDLTAAKDAKIQDWIRENRPELFEVAEAAIEYYNHPRVVGRLVDWHVKKYGFDPTTGDIYAPRRVARHGASFGGVTGDLLADFSTTGGIAAMGRRGLEFGIGKARTTPGTHDILGGDILQRMNEYARSISILSEMEPAVREARMWLQNPKINTYVEKHTKQKEAWNGLDKNFIEPVVRSLSGIRYDIHPLSGMAVWVKRQGVRANLAINFEVAAYQALSLTAAAGEMGAASRFLPMAAASMAARKGTKLGRSVSERADKHAEFKMRNEVSSALAIHSTGRRIDPTTTKLLMGERFGKADLGWSGIARVDRLVVLNIYHASEMWAQSILKKKGIELDITHPQVQALAGKIARRILIETQPTFDPLNNAAINNIAKRDPLVNILSAFRGYTSKLVDLQMRGLMRAARARGNTQRARLIAKTMVQTVLPSMIIPLIRNIVRSSVVYAGLRARGDEHEDAWEVPITQEEWEEWGRELGDDATRKVVGTYFLGDTVGSPFVTAVQMALDQDVTMRRQSTIPGDVMTRAAFLATSLITSATNEGETKLNTATRRWNADKRGRRKWEAGVELGGIFTGRALYPSRIFFDIADRHAEIEYERERRRELLRDLPGGRRP